MKQSNATLVTYFDADGAIDTGFIVYDTEDGNRNVAEDYAEFVEEGFTCVLTRVFSEEGQEWDSEAVLKAIEDSKPKAAWNTEVDGRYVRVTLTIPTGTTSPSGRGIRAHHAAHKLAKATWGDNTRIIRITSGGGSDDGSIFYTWTFSHAAM